MEKPAVERRRRPNFGKFLLRDTVYILAECTWAGKPASGDEKYAQAHFSAKRANGLAKPSNGLASRSAGLGLGAALKSKPKPEKARLRGRKPVLQAEKLTLHVTPHVLIYWKITL
ncbi:hypothetical protein B0H13DRAFT_1912682 [Mycena leptocephala]|nr:hypothetical protein B0H13DRAFT_1912682 [Mycena leptocephala]